MKVNLIDSSNEEVWDFPPMLLMKCLSWYQIKKRNKFCPLNWLYMCSERTEITHFWFDLRRIYLFKVNKIYFILFYFILFYFILFISWRLITLQYCSGFCHTLTRISHGFTCDPHPDPPSHLPLHPIPLGLPSASSPSTCLMHPIWAGDLFHPR